MSIVENEQIPRRGRGRPQIRSDEETLRVILEAAGEVFRADGYAATSMSAVAMRAGISTRTLYRLVPTKAELFSRVVTSRIGQFILEADDSQGGSSDLAADLERVLTAFARLILDPNTMAMFRLVVGECGRFPEIGQTFYVHAVGRTTAFLTEWLERRCRLGQIRLDNPREAAGMLRGMMIMEPERAAMLGQATPPSPAEIAQRARACAALFLEGCIVRT